MTDALSHDALASSLAAHLRGGSSRITWENMQLGESGSPRPDVYSMEPTYTRLSFEAFEVKVSVADFRRDVTSGKWQSYLPYANSVTFAVPQGLIAKEDVPATCGLIVRGPSGAWRYAKKPVKHVLTELPWRAWVKLLLDGVERTGYQARQARFSSWLAEKTLAKKYGEDVAQMLHDLQALPMMLKYHRTQHDEQVATMNANLAAEREHINRARSDVRERCSGELARLAKVLGLPADAEVSELQGAAARIANALTFGEHRWQATPFESAAERMETALKTLRELTALFTPRGAAA